MASFLLDLCGDPFKGTLRPGDDAAIGEVPGEFRLEKRWLHKQKSNIISSPPILAHHFSKKTKIIYK